MPQLFSKIKECRYFTPTNLSHQVQDLINRMLQPNPVKRITLSEIQEHPWFSRDLPDYLHFVSKPQKNNKKAQLDTGIVKAQFSLNLNIQKSMEAVCQDLQNQRINDYGGAYKLRHEHNMKTYTFDVVPLTAGALTSPLSHPPSPDTPLFRSATPPAQSLHPPRRGRRGRDKHRRDKRRLDRGASLPRRRRADREIR